MKKQFKIFYNIILLALTAIFAVLMTCMAGAGLIYNGESYGSGMVKVGYCLIFSGILMTVGAVLSLFRKKPCRIIAAACAVVGLALCMVCLYLLCRHADAAGWSDNYTMEPVSGMYKRRIMPVILPSAMTIISSEFGVRSSEL